MACGTFDWCSQPHGECAPDGSEVTGHAGIFGPLLLHKRSSEAVREGKRLRARKSTAASGQRRRSIDCLGASSSDEIEISVQSECTEGISSMRANGIGGSASMRRC